MLKLSNTLTKLFFASIGFFYSVHAMQDQMRNGLEQPEIQEMLTRLPKEKLKSLTVTGTARVGHLHVFEKSHLQGHLNVDDEVDVKGKLEVRGDSLIKGHAEIQGSLNCEDNVNIVKKLTVHGQGVFKDKVIIDENLHIRDDLQVDDKASFQRDLTVSGFLHAKDNLDVDEDATIRGNACVEKNLTITGNETIEGTLTVPDLTLPANLIIGGKEKISGDLDVEKKVSIVGTLDVCQTSTFSKNLNIGDNVFVAGDLMVTGSQCLEGELCISGTISAGSITLTKSIVDLLTIKNNVTIDDTLFVNEIDPLKGSETTLFSGNVAIEKCKRMCVGEINPALLKIIDEQGTILVPNEDGITCMRSTTAIDPKHGLLVNSIIPLIKVNNCDHTCSPFELGVTCFSGNMALFPGTITSDASCQTPGPTKLLVNHIDPVTTNMCGKCIEDHSDLASTCFSGNVAINPCEPVRGGILCPKKLLVNEINPVKMVDGKCFPDDTAITCFSGNVAIHPGLDVIASHTLFVNYINPVTTNTLTGACIPDQNPCASTHCSGNVSIKKGHYFGEIGTSSLEQSSELFTACLPVIRLTFNQTDPNQDPFPQGAWVKLSVYGQINVGQNNTPLVFPIDIFSELYFFVGAGNNAPCSSFVGSLNGLLGTNTLSGHACLEIIEQFAGDPGDYGIFIPSQPGQGQFGNTLFQVAPTIEQTQSVFTILGTTASSPAIPNSVDILLMGVTPFAFGLFPSINNLTVFYEIISPNLDPNNPPCFPNPLFDQAIYDDACNNLTNTYLSTLPS